MKEEVEKTAREAKVREEQKRNDTQSTSTNTPRTINKTYKDALYLNAPRPRSQAPQPQIWPTTPQPPTPSINQTKETQRPNIQNTKTNNKPPHTVTIDNIKTEWTKEQIIQILREIHGNKIRKQTNNKRTY